MYFHCPAKLFHTSDYRLLLLNVLLLSIYDYVISLQIDEEPLAILERDGVKTPITTAGIGKPEPIKDIKLVNGGHHGAVRDLLAAIDEKREPLCGPEAGRETVELTLAVFASFAAGGKATANIL